MGYYCGNQTYEIIYQTEEVMALRVENTVEGQDWVFIYCLEELNVEPPEVVKVPKAVPLAEDFEGDTFLNFVQEDMGAVSGVVDNPLPLPINTSDKVYRYWKSVASIATSPSRQPTTSLTYCAEQGTGEGVHPLVQRLHHRACCRRRLDRQPEIVAPAGSEAAGQ